MIPSRQPKVATIVPAAHLDLLDSDSYFMVLGHVAELDDEYIDYFREASHAGSTVILDNSAVELGEPMDIRHQLTIAQYIGASELVLPDYYQDRQRTIEACRDAIKVARGEYSGRLMGVPQGSTCEEWYFCCQELADMGVDTIGISYRYTEMLGGSRLPSIEYLYSTGIAVHLLGCLGDPASEVYSALGYPNVRGVDSAIASVFTHHAMSYTGQIERPPRSVNFLLDHYDSGLLASNIDTWRQRCVYGYGTGPNPRESANSS